MWPAYYSLRPSLLLLYSAGVLFISSAFSIAVEFELEDTPPLLHTYLQRLASFQYCALLYCTVTQTLIEEVAINYLLRIRGRCMKNRYVLLTSAKHNKNRP